MRWFRALSGLATGCALIAGLIAAPRERPQRRAQILSADQFFQTSKAWTLHLTFSRTAWDSLAPEPFGGVSVGPGYIGPEGKRNGISAVHGLDFEYVHADLDFEGSQLTDVAVRFKGNSTYPPGQALDKPSFKIDLNKFVKGQKLAGQSTINLHSNIIDGSLMNEELAYRLYRDAGSPASRTTYARLYITVPGLLSRTYFGLYGVVENVDTNFAESRFGVSGGAIFKPVTTAPFTDAGPSWSSYNQMYDPKTDLTDGDKQRIIDFCRLVSHATDQEFDARVAEFIDLPAFAKYMAIVVWLANPDSVLQQGQNYYVHLAPTTRALTFMPWDQDHSFGQYVPFKTPASQQQLDILHPWTPSPMGGRNRFMERMFRVEAFKRRYLTELLTLTRTVAQSDRLSKQVDELGAAIAPIVEREPNAVRVATFKRALGEAPFRRPNNPMISVVPIKTFVRARQASVVAQLKALGVQ